MGQDPDALARRVVLGGALVFRELFDGDRHAVVHGLREISVLGGVERETVPPADVGESDRDRREALHRHVDAQPLLLDGVPYGRRRFARLR